MRQIPFEETIRTLLAVVEGTELYFRGHYKRMAALCSKFAKTIGLSAEEVESLHLAGLLHDIGMVYVPNYIIHKNDALSKDEMVAIRKHPILSEKILSHLSPLSRALPMIRHHHESFDGNGYPDGLAGEDIPLGARILTLVESYFVMVSPRPYRAAINKDAVIVEIEKFKGIQFDPILVEKFIAQIEPQETTSAKVAAGPQKTPDAANENIAATIVELLKQGEIKLPLMPKIIQDLHAVLSKPNYSAADLVSIIERDPILSIRIIAAANSPLYRGQQKVRNLREAIPRIGLMETQSIVSTILNKNMYQAANKSHMAIMEKLWEHSLATGYAARAVAETLGYSDIEKYFLMGLVHDIGKVLILRVIGETPLVWENVGTTEIEKTFEKAHLSVGSVILRHWKFPKEFFEVATSHEGPRFFKTTGKATLIVNVANMLTRTIGYSLFEETVDFGGLDSVALLKIDPKALPPIGDKVKQLMEESKSAF